ncbi:hypothetical protein DM01DRAFT_1385298 [Hesseltinella vesiculosa]|uniref:Zn(2)-C6 fungal-type domain-containing protein n=1 Tax=Hesseltinella vesiculosa TaxID=101127 RepID=A0A1X2GBP3_9FUNG|nr:hypothetical protein DM01DRAFT_1385298 [Hesseltinella vesiculosa]
MLKSISCTECRKQHRKCVRTNQSVECVRCFRMHLDCVMPSADHLQDQDETVDGSKQLRQMKASVAVLQSTIQQLELQMHQLQQPPDRLDDMDTASIGSQATTASLTPSSSTSSATSLTQPGHPLELFTLQQYLQDMYTHVSAEPHPPLLMQVVTSSSPSPLLHHPPRPDDLLLEKGKEWKVTFVDGRWQIDTGIKSMAELLQLQTKLYRQLSPFQGVSRFLEIELSQVDRHRQSVFQMSARVARNHLLLPPSTPVAWDRSRVPTMAFHIPNRVVNSLIKLHFQFFHDYLPFVYKDAYLAHLRQLKDPMQCPLTTALCSYVCCGYYKDIPPIKDLPWFNNSQDRRTVAEYFYERCRAVLDDIYDDPNRRLETVMCINILKRFLMNTLRVSEMRKLDTIAYLICMDLKNHYKHAQLVDLEGQPFPSPTPASPGSPPSSPSASPPTVSIAEHAVFARHYAFSAWAHVCLDFFTPDGPDLEGYHKSWDLIPLLPLPGESNTLRQYLEMQSHYFALVLAPAVYNLFEHIQTALLGYRVAFDLEIFLRFQSCTREWWQRLPPEFRLCDDPDDPDTIRQAIRDCEDDVKLVLYVFYLDLVTSCYVCLPRAKSMSADNDPGLLQQIQSMCVNASLEAAEMLMLIMARLDANISYSQFVGDVFLFVAVDILAHHAQSDDPDLVRKAKDKLAACFQVLENADFMEGHRVDLAASPLTHSLLDSNAAMFHLYNQYPQPRYALLYDLCRFLSPLNGYMPRTQRLETMCP